MSDFILLSFHYIRIEQINKFYLSLSQNFLIIILLFISVKSRKNVVATIPPTVICRNKSAPAHSIKLPKRQNYVFLHWIQKHIICHILHFTGCGRKSGDTYRFIVLSSDSHGSSIFLSFLSNPILQSGQI